ncbi:hypothetical protein BBJ28_00019388 [Nothophytophthora sp. Chile5]|nr:hypothetical protein BBJ28_00019388 [Nothophytophthora sp. Chile5]
MIRQQYRLEEKIADSLYGSVRVCSDTHASNELVAIKQVSLELARSVLDIHPDVDNPWHEQRTVTNLLALPSHPNVLRFRSEFLHNESWFVVMDYCNGGDLWQKVMSAPNSRLKEEEALLAFRDVVRGVQFLHSHGIAHRDLALENVLLHDGVYKIADFGLSTDAERMCSEVVGRAYYMAPEVAAQEAYAPMAADMWSLGILLFIMLTGSPLVQKATEHEPAFTLFSRLGVHKVLQAWSMTPFVSDAACNLMAALLQRDPAKRPSTTEALTHPCLQQLQ